MLIQTKAIVINSFPYKDNQVIAKLYTDLRGMVSTIVRLSKNASKSKSALIQPLTLIDASIYLKENHDFVQLRDIQIWKPFQHIPFDFRKQAQAMFVAELLRHAIKEEEKNTQLFDFIVESLEVLDNNEFYSASFHLQFMLELSKYLGFYPIVESYEENYFLDLKEGFFIPFQTSSTCQAIESKLLYDFSVSKSANNGLNSRFPRNALFSILEQYYRHHLPNFPEMNTPGIMAGIFED